MTGFKSKRAMSLYSRGYGKSVWNQMIAELMQPDMQILTQAQVDDKTWYTVKLTSIAADWLRLQPKNDWVEHTHQPFGGGVFDVSEQMYSALALKWK